MAILKGFSYPALGPKIDRLARIDGWTYPSPAHAIIELCRVFGVALNIDSDGTLIVGKALRLMKRRSPG